MPTARRKTSGSTTPRSSVSKESVGKTVSSPIKSSSPSKSNGTTSSSSSLSKTVGTPRNANGHVKAPKPIVEKEVHFVWPFLAIIGMTLVPLAVYWCWLSCEYNKGTMILPKEYTSEGVKTWFVNDVMLRLYEKAWPTWYAWKIYVIWLVFQAILFIYAPGPIGEGTPVIDGPDEGKRLKYKYNGQFAWGVTLIIAFIVHYTGVFPLTELYYQFGPLQTVCNLYTAGLIAVLYIYAAFTGKLERQTNSVVYDYFMGPMLNPRIGNFDIKFFHELRPGIMQWFFTTIGCAIKQYEDYGYITTPMALVCFYHLCFVNACYKGEQCVPMSMDIIYEKFGWMLCWLDLVTVPFVFPLQAYYLYNVGPFEHPLLLTIAVALMHIIGYWIFDTANAQKDYFRASKKPGEHIPYGFPRLPWDKLDNPKYMDTERGTKLLLDGWWKYARHMNYLGDLMMAWSWGLTCGVSSYFPYAYTTYLTPLLLHRERRDNIECQRKYGKDWERYCKVVPYRLIPGVY